jgi:hypothetical protein
MSDTYLSTGTMALNEEDETDYNIFVPIWEQLKLPFGPLYSQGLGLKNTELFDPVKQSVSSLPVENEVDWATFDFTGKELSSTESPSDLLLEESSAPAQDEQIAAFFKNFDTSADSDEEKGGLLLLFFSSDSNNAKVEIETGMMATVGHSTKAPISKYSNLVAPPFSVPAEWVDKNEFKNHVRGISLTFFVSSYCFLCFR